MMWRPYWTWVYIRPIHTPAKLGIRVIFRYNEDAPEPYLVRLPIPWLRRSR